MREAAEEFGLLKADAEGAYTEFREKPKVRRSKRCAWTRRASASTPTRRSAARPRLDGHLLFDFKKLEELLAANDEWGDFGKQIIRHAIERGNVQAFVFDDTGRTSAAYRLPRRQPRHDGDHPQVQLLQLRGAVYTRARYLPPSKINNSQIMMSNMSEGCIINRAHITRSVIGLRTRIDHGAHIEDSYLMGADWYQSLEEMRAEKAAGVPRVGIGEGSFIRNAIVDKNARIGAGVRLVNEAGLREYDAPDGSVHIPRASSSSRRTRPSPTARGFSSL